MCKGKKDCGCGCNPQYGGYTRPMLTYANGGPKKLDRHDPAINLSDFTNKKDIALLQAFLASKGYNLNTADRQFANYTGRQDVLSGEILGKDISIRGGKQGYDGEIGDVTRQAVQHYNATRLGGQNISRAYGGLVGKDSGSGQLNYNPDLNVSNSAFDAGQSVINVDTSALEGTTKERFKDVGRTAAQATMGQAIGAVEGVAAMGGANLDIGGNMKLGEMTSQDLANQQKVGNIGQVAGSVGAGLATIALTGNVQLGAKPIGKGFDNLGDVDPNSKGLQTVSNVGQAGSQIASMVGPTGGAPAVGGGAPIGTTAGVDAAGNAVSFAPGANPEGTGTAFGDQLNQIGAYGIPNMQAGGSVKTMAPGGPVESGTEALLDYLGAYDTSADPLSRQRQYQTDISTTKENLQTEKDRVQSVRDNIIPMSKELEALHERIREAGSWFSDDKEGEKALEAFERMLNPKGDTIAEKKAYLRKEIKDAPKLLKKALPQSGSYNLFLANSEKYSPKDELYCTPYGCFAYQKAGAKDLPTLSGNFGLAAGIKSGKYPFEKVSYKDVVPGDLALLVDYQPIDYRNQSLGWSLRPHHTTIVAGKGKGEDAKNPNVIEAYQATEGHRMEFEKKKIPAERIDYYRYTGQVPNIENSIGYKQQAMDALVQSGAFDMEPISPIQPTAVNKYAHGGPAPHPTDPPYYSTAVSTSTQAPEFRAQDSKLLKPNPKTIHDYDPKRLIEETEKTRDRLSQGTQSSGPSLVEILKYGPGEQPSYMTASGRKVDEDYYEPTLENVAEFFDPTGALSYDDAHAAYNRMKARGADTPNLDEGLDMFGAIPLVGKAKKAIILSKGTKRAVYKALEKFKKPWNKFLEWVDYINKADAIEDETDFLDRFQDWIKTDEKTYQAGGPTDPPYAAQASTTQVAMPPAPMKSIEYSPGLKTYMAEQQRLEDETTKEIEYASRRLRDKKYKDVFTNRDGKMIFIGPDDKFHPQYEEYMRDLSLARPEEYLSTFFPSPESYKYGGGLRRWFKEEWVDVKTGKKCGRSGKEKSKREYPYCRPSKKVSSKTPATSKHSEAKSRAKQKTGPSRVKPIMRKRSKK